MFVNSTKLFLENFSDNQIYNTDQSGFNKEVHYGRTLDYRGIRHVEAIAQSISATTHSYTIQPTTSKNEKLLSPFYFTSRTDW
jgi:hypothetical protein